MPPRSAPWRWSITWIVALGLSTALMLSVRDNLEKTHIALVFLLLVLGASATAGSRLGFAIAFVSFLLFNFLFLPPYYRLSLDNPLDWLVLLAFLVTAVVAAQLLDLAQRQAREASARADEIARLGALGAEALNAPRADLAIASVENVIRDSLRLERCVVHRASSGPGDDLIAAVLDSGAGYSVLADGTTRMIAPAGLTGEWTVQGADSTRLVLPLRVRDRTVGVLELGDPDGLALDQSQYRMLDAMRYYAALGVERARLAAEADHVEALREADRLKDSLIASVSHDLRTPLTTIKALAHGMTSLGDERAELIEREADRLNRLVSDLLDLSRLAAGGVRLTIEAVPVDELVGGAVQQVEGILGGRRLDVDLGPDSLLVGRFDLMHSIRILVNLIENAHKYAPATAPIEIRTGRSGQWIDISVADRGPGVPPDEAERIFQPLYRPASAPVDVGSAGLGLAIARQFAEAQHGYVVYEARPGGGSVFTLRLPAVDVNDIG